MDPVTKENMDEEKRKKNQKLMNWVGVAAVVFAVLFRAICALLHFFSYFQSRAYCLADAIIYSFTMLVFGIGLQLFIYSKHHSDLILGFYQAVLGGTMIYAGHNLVLSQATEVVNEFFNVPFHICKQYENMNLFSFVENDQIPECLGYFFALFGARSAFALPYIFGCMLLENFVKIHIHLMEMSGNVRNSFKQFYGDIRNVTNEETADRSSVASSSTRKKEIARPIDASLIPQNQVDNLSMENKTKEQIIQELLRKEQIMNEFLTEYIQRDPSVNPAQISAVPKKEIPFSVLVLKSVAFVVLLNIAELACEFGLEKLLHKCSKSENAWRVVYRFLEAAIYVGFEVLFASLPFFIDKWRKENKSSEESEATVALLPTSGERDNQAYNQNEDEELPKV